MTSTDKLLEAAGGKPIAAPDPQGAPAPVAWAGNDSGGAGELKALSDWQLCELQAALVPGGPIQVPSWWRGAVSGSKARSVLRMAAVQQKGVADVSGVISAGSLGD